MTADPPSRLAAILEPLRPFAEEIVIAADSRVGDETLAGYDAIADTLFSVEYRQLERHLAWLFAQCRGDWVMRLDGDEVPSTAFVRRLPELLASRAVQQFWTPNAWLFPDAGRSLAGAPWSHDFVCRLARNDGTLRVRGLQHLHLEPLAPREYLNEPFYHLDLLTSGPQERRDKVVRYEVARPHVTAAGGGRLNDAFYLPELRDSLELDSVPDEDRARIAQALGKQSPPASGLATALARPISLEDMDRMWEGRPVAQDAYRARIEAYRAPTSLAPATQQHVFVTVSNQGGERWPGGADAHPAIRLSYRWLRPDGSVHTPEGPRSPLSRAIDPGERVLTPLHVDAPAECGDYVLEVDLVHEDVRWFDCATRVPIRVEDPEDIPRAGTWLTATERPRWQRWRRVRIPRVIHRVWVGEKPMPPEHERFGRTFAEHHPGWEMRLWTDDDLADLDITPEDRRLSRTHSELSNLVRYEVLSRHGGVYVDTDVESRRSLAPLLRGIEAFAALELPGRVGTAVLGSVAGHPAFARAARLARRTLGLGAHSVDANGPYMMSLLLEQEPGVAILPANRFYPYSWEEPERRHEAFPDAYAVHHWTLSWAAAMAHAS